MRSKTGAAYGKFVEMIEAQGSNREALERLEPDPVRHIVCALNDGFVAGIDAVELGNLARRLISQATGPASWSASVKAIVWSPASRWRRFSGMPWRLKR